MATFNQAVINRLNKVVKLVNELIQKALKTEDLPTATTPLGSTDLIRVSQGGISRKCEVQFLPGQTGADGTKIFYEQWQIYGAQGNVLSTLQVGDMVTGWFNTTEFWILARYDGPDPALKTSYTVLRFIDLS